jgi:hypothetical protein
VELTHEYDFKQNMWLTFRNTTKIQQCV